MKENCGPFMLQIISSPLSILILMVMYLYGKGHHLQLKFPLERFLYKESQRKKGKVGIRFLSYCSNDKEDERITHGGELASGVISFEQNKLIGDSIMRKKLVRNGHLYNFPITHIHRPPIYPRTSL